MHIFVVKLLSIAVMILLRLSPPKSTSGKFVTHTANALQHATAACAHDARPHCRLMSPFVIKVKLTKSTGKPYLCMRKMGIK